MKPIALLLFALGAFTAGGEEKKALNIKDPFILLADSMCEASSPADPDPGSWGMDPATGKFVHPEATPHQHGTVSFEGELDHWDTNEYAKNVKVEAYYPWVVEPFHTWQNIVDFDGRRYLYQYVRTDLGIFDITDPKDVKKVYEKGNPWGPEGPGESVNPYADGDMFGAASIMWNAELGKMVMVQSFEIRRFGVINDKRTEPDKVAMHRRSDHLKGFKVYEMNGPLPEDWTLLSEVTTDVLHPNAPIGEQEGSGVRDIPTYFGGKYMFLATAPDDTWGLTEYPTDLYSPAIKRGTCRIRLSRDFSISLPRPVRGSAIKRRTRRTRAVGTGRPGSARGCRSSSRRRRRKAASTATARWRGSGSTCSTSRTPAT